MNIYESVYQQNAKHPGKCALSITMNDGTRRMYTYGEVFQLAETYARHLTDAGVRAGDRVAFAAEGSSEWTIAFFAVCKLRCTAALIDASLTAQELDGFIRQSDVRAAFFSPKTEEKFKTVPDYGFPVFNILDCSVLEGYRASVSPDLPATPDPDETVAAIIFSSGTTRRAAGIMHTHDNLIDTTRMTLDVQKLTENDRYLAIIPNSHIYGVICLVLGPALSGADAHYIESLSADAVLGAFNEYHPTVLPAVPKVYELFMTQIMRKIKSSPITAAMFKALFPVCLEKRRKTGSLLGKKVFKSIHEGFGGSLNFLCSAGAPMNKDVAEFYYGTGFNILMTYGASETNIPTIGNVPDDIQTDSCGKPYPAVSVRFSDSGEILIKSPYMMKGYFRDEAATKAAFTEDGYFMTGDLGERDANGYIRVTGRSKENIVLASGKKIAPDDLEEKYADLRGVKEFVICGVPQENTDYDEIHAFVVPEGITQEDRDAIKAQILEKGSKLIQNMRISTTHFVSEIPRTSLQKPKRYLLKQQALKERETGVTEEAPTASEEDNMTARVISVVSKVANAEAKDITPKTRIFSELSIDSLSAINLALELEDIYHVNIEDYYSDDMTVGDIVLALQNKAAKKKQIGKSNVVYPLKKSDSDYHTYAFFRNMAQFCYHVNIHDADNIPTDQGFIICANHVSKIDYLYLAAAFPKERFKKLCCMAKKELFRNDAFSRKLIKIAGMVPVDRSGINMQTMNSLCDKLRQNWGVIIHPEGTRSEDGVFREIKSGASVLAINAGVPIVPAFISGAYEVFPKGRKTMKVFDWKHMKKFQIDVTFGKPIFPENKEISELTKEVQDAIAALQEKSKK